MKSSCENWETAVTERVNIHQANFIRTGFEFEQINSETLRAPKQTLSQIFKNEL